MTSLRPGGYDEAVTSSDRLVAFLYTLMRDFLVPGSVEGIVTELEDAEERFQKEPEYQFSNDFLAAYAIEIAARLRGKSPATALALAHSNLTTPREPGPSRPEALPRISQLPKAEERQ